MENNGFQEEKQESGFIKVREWCDVLLSHIIYDKDKYAGTIAEVT